MPEVVGFAKSGGLGASGADRERGGMGAVFTGLTIPQSREGLTGSVENGRFVRSVGV